MTEYAPQAIKDLFNRVHDAIPAALMGGIQGDEAHTYGYHRGRNYVSGSDYSVQLAPDQKGHGEACCGLDISWSTAQPQYDVSKRLLNAKNDPRMIPIREFYGSTDGRTVCGWDYPGGYAVTSDSSHLWHIHLSILRQYADDTSALAQVADVITGKQSGEDGDDDVPKNVAVSSSVPIKVTALQEKDLVWDTTGDDIHDVFWGTKSEPRPGIHIPGSYFVASIMLTIDGMAHDDTFLTSVSLVDNNDGEFHWRMPWDKRACTVEPNYVTATRVGTCGKGEAIRARVKSSKNCTLTAAALRVLFWAS